MWAPGLWIIGGLIAALDLPASRAKLITGIAPCPTGAPPARECLVSVLVDLRALRARARLRNGTALPPERGDKEPTPSLQPGYNLVAETDLAVSKPGDGDLELRRQYEEQVQEQQRKQSQLERAVRFQEDELQLLREQVQELREQLARALQLYQLQLSARAPLDRPAIGPSAKFYSALPRDFTQPYPAFGQRIQRRAFREVASGLPVVATVAT